MAPPRLASLLFLFFLSTSGIFFHAAHAQDDNGDGKPPPNMDYNMFGDQNQVCPSYSCPKPYVPLNKWPLGISSVGCQSESGMAMMMAGGGNQYKHIEHCCHFRNACYQLCGSNKKVCDADMEKCMEKSCKELPDSEGDLSNDEIKKEQEECTKMKSIVDMIGKIGGCNVYDNHQRQHCECIDKAKVGDKMERVMRNFYKKFNPDGIDKVKGLVEKANGKRAAFNKILYGLVKKYPAAIKKVVPEVPDIMKMDL